MSSPPSSSRGPAQGQRCFLGAVSSLGWMSSLDGDSAAAPGNLLGRPQGKAAPGKGGTHPLPGQARRLLSSVRQRSLPGSGRVVGAGCVPGGTQGIPVSELALQFPPSPLGLPTLLSCTVKPHSPRGTPVQPQKDAAGAVGVGGKREYASDTQNSETRLVPHSASTFLGETHQIPSLSPTSVSSPAK